MENEGARSVEIPEQKRESKVRKRGFKECGCCSLRWKERNLKECCELGKAQPAKSGERNGMEGPMSQWSQ